ncbi:MAG: hypothetical protein HY080_12540 [Gammaproteobacteria bacterium]|nr:hypothetical protein [Gammaproteobacteria bacterium]
MVSFLALTWFPSHIHIHHPLHNTAYSVVDQYSPQHFTDESHRQDVTVQQPAPEGLLNFYTTIVLPAIVLLVAICLLVPTVLRVRRVAIRYVFPSQLHFNSTPPLRAPPR